MEMSSLPVELTVIWNGDFSIDNPAHNKGNYVELYLFAYMYDSNKVECVYICVHTTPSYQFTSVVIITQLHTVS